MRERYGTCLACSFLVTRTCKFVARTVSAPSTIAATAPPTTPLDRLPVRTAPTIPADPLAATGDPTNLTATRRAALEATRAELHVVRLRRATLQGITDLLEHYIARILADPTSDDVPQLWTAPRD